MYYISQIFVIRPLFSFITNSRLTNSEAIHILLVNDRVAKLVFSMCTCTLTITHSNNFQNEKNSCTKDATFEELLTHCMNEDEASHLNAFRARDSSPHILVTHMKVMRSTILADSGELAESRIFHEANFRRLLTCAANGCHAPKCREENFRQ